MSWSRKFKFTVGVLAIVLCNEVTRAQLSVVADYTFDDPSSLTPFTQTGTPSVSDGQLQLDGSSFLEIADPLAGAVDNFSVEAILTAGAFNAFDFAFARNDPAGDNGGNNGQGLLFQDFGGGVGQIGVLNSFCCATHGFGAGPNSVQLPLNTPTALAAVVDGGTTELYINGVMVNETTAGAIVGVPTNFGIGTHPFDGAAGAFNGSIDRVRLSTFSAGTFDPGDLLVVDPELSLEINTTTGSATLTTVGPFPGNVIGYDITSAAGIEALIPSGWTSITDNYDADSGPTGGVQVDDNDNWSKFPASSTSLAEAELNDPAGDGAQLGAGLSMSLGNIWTPNPFGQDIAMELLLDDGARQLVTVVYDGSPVNPLKLGDFSGNGTVDAADWPTIRDNFDADVSALTPAAGYNLGDINLDGMVNVLDFGEFKTLFIAEQGAAAFAALVAGSSVPEPSTCILVALGSSLLVGARRKPMFSSTASRRHSVNYSGYMFVGAMLLGVLSVSGGARAASTSNAIYRLGEDDPGAVNGGSSASTVDLIGGPNLTAGGTGAITYSSNTPNPPGGSTLAASLNNQNFYSGPFVAAGTEIAGGITEVDNFGMEAWVFANGFEAFDFIANNGTGGGGIDGEPSTGYGLIQQNGVWNFLHNGVAFRGSSTTAASTGQWVHLAGVVDNGTSRLFVNGVEEDAVPGLPRSPSDSPTTSVMTIGSNPFDAPNGLFDGIVDHVRLFSFEAGDFEPDRDLSFNTLIDGDVLPALLTLQIARSSGNGSIVNNSGETLSLDYYAIESATGVADPSWTGLTPMGDGSGNGWENLGTPSANKIQQAFLDGDTELLNGASSNPMGSVFTGSGQTDEDGVTFTYRSPQGVLRTGLVEFIDGIAGDFDGNNIINGVDFVQWQRGFPGAFDQADLADWEAGYGFGVSSSAASTAVPEPTSAALALLGGALWWHRRRREANPQAVQLMTAMGAALLLAASPLSVARAAVTLDRDYQLGDDSVEGAVLGGEVGANFTGPAGRFTADSAVVDQTNFVDAQDIQVFGTPTYVDVSSRLGATSGALGARFDGVGEYLLTAISLNSPNAMWDEIAFFPSNDYPLNYDGIFGRGIQLWVNPDSAKQNVAQDVVIDTLQHGITITEDNTWGLWFGGRFTDTETAVTFNDWTHVMNAFGIMYVDGVAVAADGGFYFEDLSALSIGANQDGSANFFQGTLDDVKLFVFGDNSGTTETNNNPGAVGMDYGDFNLAEDNDWVVATLADMGVTDPADVDLDGDVDAGDITAFLPTWKSENVVDGVQVGDWNSRQNGDLDYNGIVDLDDAFILHNGLRAAGFTAGFPFEALGAGVPEPGSAALAAVAVAALSGRGRRKRIRS